VEGDDPDEMRTADGRDAGGGPRAASRRSRAMRGVTGDHDPAALADDRAEVTQGWTGPKVVDGLQVEGTFRAHQVPLLVDADHPDHLAQLESWMRSYHPEERSMRAAGCCPSSPISRPWGSGGWALTACQRRPAAARPCGCPIFRGPCGRRALPRRRGRQDTLVLGEFLRDVAGAQLRPAELPDLRSRRDASEPARRCVSRSPAASGTPRRRANDEFLAPGGRVLDSMLPSTSARAAGRLPADRAGTGCFNCYRRSSTSSIPCSTSTPSG